MVKWYGSGKANNCGLRAITNNCHMGYVLPADIRARPVGIKRLTVDAKTEGREKYRAHQMPSQSSFQTMLV